MASCTDRSGGREAGSRKKATAREREKTSGTDIKLPETHYINPFLLVRNDIVSIGRNCGGAWRCNTVPCWAHALMTEPCRLYEWQSPLYSTSVASVSRKVYASGRAPRAPTAHRRRQVGMAAKRAGAARRWKNKTKGLTLFFAIPPLWDRTIANKPCCHQLRKRNKVPTAQ